MIRVPDGPASSRRCRLIQVVILPLNVNKSVAARSSHGIILSKVDCRVLSRRMEPTMLPRKVMIMSGRMRLSNSTLRALRYAPVEANVPGQSATVLVALALMEGTPEKSKAGKAINPPPPATEFTIPPAMAAKKRRMKWGKFTQHSIVLQFMMACLKEMEFCAYSHSSASWVRPELNAPHNGL